NRVDHKKFLNNKPDLPPHRDFNDKWDDDDWPKHDQSKKP
ncbi:YpfN family protein, partial [Klebsiella pneumoniae]